MQFLQTLVQLPSQLKHHAAQCPKKQPSRDELLSLRPKISEMSTFIISLGNKGSLDLLSECSIYGMFDKDYAPNTPQGWIKWLGGLDTYIEDKTGVQSTSIVPSGDVEVVEIEYSQHIKTHGSWWDKAWFSVGKTPITPLRLGVGLMALRLVRLEMQKRRSK